MFEGVPTYTVERGIIDAGIPVVELLAAETDIFPSKGELRRSVKGNALSINKEKIADPEHVISSGDLINETYILVQKGKKNYYIVEIR